MVAVGRAPVLLVDVVVAGLALLAPRRFGTCFGLPVGGAGRGAEDTAGAGAGALTSAVGAVAGAVDGGCC